MRGIKNLTAVGTALLLCLNTAQSAEAFGTDGLREALIKQGLEQRSSPLDASFHKIDDDWDDGDRWERRHRGRGDWDDDDDDWDDRWDDDDDDDRWERRQRGRGWDDDDDDDDDWDDDRWDDDDDDRWERRHRGPRGRDDWD